MSPLELENELEELDYRYTALQLRILSCLLQESMDTFDIEDQMPKSLAGKVT